jgi:hypothetical protein
MAATSSGRLSCLVSLVMTTSKPSALALGVQLDVLRASPALELVDVDDFMCLQQDAHDLGAAATGIATGRHTSVPFFGHPPTAPVGAA